MGIKERCPMEYMPYIEHFWRATGLRLNGLHDFTAWIKQGSYYHRLVAQQGHLHKCPHLAGVVLPRWPQVTPSESRRELQKKADTPATSSSEPNARVMAAPVMETPVTQTPVVETPAVHSNTPAPMETGRRGDSQSWAERVEAGIDEEFQQIGPRSVAGPDPGGTSKDRCFPSPSKTVRGGLPPFHSSMSMLESSLPPTTMWPAEGSCICIQRYCHTKPHTSEIRSSA